MEEKGKTIHKKWYCPNCARLCSGVVEYSGDVNIRCPGCGTVMTMKKMSRRQYQLIIFMPS